MLVWIWCSWQHDLHTLEFPVIRHDEGFNVYEMTEDQLKDVQSLYDVDYPKAWDGNPDTGGGKRIGRDSRAYYIGRGYV